MMNGGEGWGWGMGWGMGGSGWIGLLVVGLIAVGIAFIIVRRRTS